MKKEVLINIELEPEEAAEMFTEYSAEEFALMLNAFGESMETWGVGRACMQMDFVGMSSKLTDKGRFAASMIAKAAETS